LTEIENATPAPEAGRWADIFTGRFAVYTLVLGLGMTLFATNQFVVTTIMPSVVAELGGVDFYSWAFSLFAVGAIVGAASAGPMREAFGARRSFLAANLTLAVGLAGAAIAPDMPVFVAFRLIQGIGGGAVASQCYGLVAVLYPPHLRGRILSVISTIWGLATVAGPGYGGVFAALGFWPGAMWSLVGAALVVAWLGWHRIQGGAGHGRLSELPFGRLGCLGAAVLVLSASSLPMPLAARVALIVAATAIAAVVFAADARAERPMFPRAVIRMTTAIGAHYWIVFFVTIVLTFVNTYTTFYLQALHGMDPFSAGYLFAIQSLMWTVGALAFAPLSTRFESHAVTGGVLVVLVAAIGVAYVAVPGPLAAIAVAIGGVGLGIGTMNNPTIQRIMAAAPADEGHIAGASVQTVRNLGISTGAALSGTVAAAAGLADGASRAVIARAIEWVYGAGVLFAAAAVAIVLGLALGNRPRR